MSDNPPPGPEEPEDGGCCGQILAICVWLVGVGFFFMLYFQPLTFLFVVGLVVVGGLALFLLMWLFGLMFRRNLKDRRYEKMMEGYKEQDWMKDR